MPCPLVSPFETLIRQLPTSGFATTKHQRAHLITQIMFMSLEEFPTHTLPHKCFPAAYYWAFVNATSAAQATPIGCLSRSTKEIWTKLIQVEDTLNAPYPFKLVASVLPKNDYLYCRVRLRNFTFRNDDVFGGCAVPLVLNVTTTNGSGLALLGPDLCVRVMCVISRPAARAGLQGAACLRAPPRRSPSHHCIGPEALSAAVWFPVYAPVATIQVQHLKLLYIPSVLFHRQ